jgi:hypothetical protein
VVDLGPTRTAGIRRVVDLGIHVMRGCRLVPLRQFDRTSQRFVSLGSICRVCDRSSRS